MFQRSMGYIDTMYRRQFQSYRVRILVAILTGLLLLAGWPAASHAQEGPIYSFQECEAIEEATLRDELNRITQEIFASGREGIDVPRLVDRKWIELGIDRTIDSEIEAAVARIYQNESYWNRFLSGWSTDKAKEFSERIAIDAFGSEGFRAKIDELSNAVATAIADEMTVVSARSASSALLCVQSFVGDSYSDTMAALFEAEIAQQVGEIDMADVDTNVIPLLQSHTRSLAGIGVIIGSQIAKRLAQQLARRIAGQVVGRVLGKAATTIIPVVGWIIGGGLIVWDLIEGGRGALPQIQSALQDESVKASIRQEVAETVQDELRKEMPAVARTVSNDVYSTWIEFRRKYTQVLELADENQNFHTLVDSVTTEDVGKLATLVVTVEETLGRERLLQLIDQGTLGRLLYLPQSAYEILRTTANPELVLAWADLAGADLEKVVALDLYKLSTPQSFSGRADLNRILALDDHATVGEIMLLNQLERDVLLTLPRQSLVRLSTLFDAEDLRWLASYIAQMEPRESNLLVERLLRDPSLMDKLQHEPVRQAVLSSQNVEETLAFLSTDAVAVQQSPVEQVGRVVADTERLLSGEVTWLLFWRKYGTLRNLLILLGAVVVLFVGVRLLWRRSQPVHVTVNIPRERD
ncbi:MAG: hypothetical protein KF893_07815 [Caldilineaceae bacterium]|nr:hypothetical protein [Caldilineaceae bacterium]